MEDGYEALDTAEVALDHSDAHPNHLGMIGGIRYRPEYHKKDIETYERVL